MPLKYVITVNDIHRFWHGQQLRDVHNGQISEKSKVENEGGHNRIFHTSVNQMDIGTMKAQMILSSKRLSFPKADIYTAYKKSLHLLLYVYSNYPL